MLNDPQVMKSLSTTEVKKSPEHFGSLSDAGFCSRLFGDGD
jgi:hypothetical protein